MFCANSDKLRQGDIVKAITFPQLGGSFPGICLTPICDLTPQEQKDTQIIKADYVIFCLLTLDIEFFKEEFKENKKKTNGVIKEILRYLQGKYPRYYWIYNPEKKKGYMIDYQVVQSIPYGEAEKLEIVSSLKSSYKERVAYGYSSYSGRIGTEDLECEKIATEIAKAIGYE